MENNMALTKAQLEERRTGIGGSDAATVLGLNPFTTAYELYLDKIGEAPENTEENPQREEAFYWGSVLEQPVADRYAKETGYKVQKANQLIRSKEHPFMVANIDRKVVGEDRRIGFEAKTSARSDGWGESGSAEIPPYIMLQCQHYLAVTGYDVWDLAVLIGNRDYRSYRINPIESIINELIEAEQEFWDRVENRVAPEPQWQSAATTRLIKDLYPGTNGQVIALPEVAQKYHDVQKDAEAQRKLFDGIIEGCKNRMAMLMGEAAIGIMPDQSAYTRKLQKRKEFVVKASEFVATRHTTKLPVDAVKAIENGTVLSLENEDDN
jgi:putative phage-type endonuclease